MDDVQLKLPAFKGRDIEEHFHRIATEQSEPYKKQIEILTSLSVPLPPSKWEMCSGWTFYDNTNGPHWVPYPHDDALIFDIEVCMKEGQAATMACALGSKGWYSWTSPTLIKAEPKIKSHPGGMYTADQMIPIESENAEHSNPKIIVGHNVSFDRARIREQYLLNESKTRFLDTMSLHVCVSGLTSYQRAMLKSNKEMSEEDLGWSSISSLNSLAEVYKLYCGKTLDKEKRNIFMEGCLDDVRENFQDLMNYCSSDVRATHQVLCQLYPMFVERFPHPATLAGMLEIGMAYLPVNSNWNRYINESNLTYEDLNIEAKYLLEKRANQACRMMHNENYKKDLWMWDQDWSQQELKFKKQIAKTNTKIQSNDIASEEKCHLNPDDKDKLNRLHCRFKHLVALKDLLPARRPLLPGYPAWYRKLCEKPTERDWSPGPRNIGTGMQVSWIRVKKRPRTAWCST